MALAVVVSAFSSSAIADTPVQPTEQQRALANQTISDGNYRIYTVVNSTKYYLTTQSDRSVIFTSNAEEASEYTFEYKTGLGKFVNEGWRISYNDAYRFSNGSNSASDSQTHLSMAESKNDRVDFERQVWYAQEDAANAGEYVYAVRATNATCADELVWQAWSKNCYWTVNTTAALPYPCYDVANAGKGSFVWKLESMKEPYAPLAVYNINEVTAEQFAKNPTDNKLWRFEQFDYAKGEYSLFTQYSDSNAANYVDIYQPCRVGGERIVEVDGIETISNNNTFAANPRFGWSNYAVYNDGGTTNDSKKRFSYVVRDEKLGYELYGNDEYTSVISFVVPEDGFYQMDATVVRQDVPDNRGRLSVVPRYRYSTASDINYANPRYSMPRMLFGQIGGEIDGFVAGSAHINSGAEQRYTAQQPEDISMAFEGKAGDIISFEVNTDSTNTISSWARDYYARMFFKNLTLSLVTETYAKQNGNFADTYGESDVVATLLDLVNKYEEFLSDAEFGDDFGQYNMDLGNQVYDMTGYIYDAIAKGQVHAFNADSYLDDLQALWRKFIESKVDINIHSEGNYPLFYTDLVTNEIVYDAEVMAQNADTPWGYYYYDVAQGSYTKFGNHNTGSKYGTGCDAWYKGAGDWLYISDNGQMHPMTNLAPAIMFTAPKDGVYKVDFGCYRPNPNASVENPLYIRARFMDSATTTQDKESFMYAKEFGSVANDGQGGKAPITMQYFVNMKAGDKITWELDCYTSNRNSSAATQITTLTVCSELDEGQPYTLEYAAASGLDVFDAYSIGDPAALNEAIASAQAILDAHKDNVGTEGGQYSPVLCDELSNLIEKATAMAANGDTQYNMDMLSIGLNNTASAFVASRLPYEFFIEGNYSINVAGTEKYLTQKNKNANGSNYYATYTDIAGVVADATKNNVDISEYNWTFTFRKFTKQVPTGEYDEATGDDITIPVEQTSIFNANGYVSQLGYVQAGEDNAAPAFRFFKEEADAETFAIMNEDGKYWNTSFSWASPYDKVALSDTPVYAFILSDMTLEQATGVIGIEGSAVVVSTEYFTTSGTKVANPVKGINIRVQHLDNGNKIVSKVLVK